MSFWNVNIHIRYLDIPNMTSSILAAGKEFEVGRKVIRFDQNKQFSLYPFKKFNKRNLDLENLSKEIKNLTLHHSVTYNVQQTFTTLVSRGLSVNFAIDDDPDGTIYQFLDIKDAGWSQKICNDTGSGIEICYHPEAYKNKDLYSKENQLKFKVNDHPILEDVIHNNKLSVFGPSKPQMESLIALILCYNNIFPQVKLNFPKDENGILKTIYNNSKDWNGLLCHYHIDRGKIDPAGMNLDELEKELQIRYSLGY